VVSTALAEMQRIVAERYPLEDWNIYAAQASDGDNYSGDSETCTRLLRDELLPLCQYFAYVEVVDEREAGCSGRSERERALARLQGRGRRPCEFRDAAGVLQGRYLPVFHQLFSKTRKAA